MKSNKIRLGVNIDHVATIRNARGGIHPSPVSAAILAEKSGADGITVHLREDRRHIRDEDLISLKKNINLPINLEMAATDEMLNIALETKPNAICIVPEKRKEVTTEGGLDVIKNEKKLLKIITEIKKTDQIRISLFVDPNINQIQKAKDLGADIVELHSGEFCNQKGKSREDELEKIINCAKFCEEIELECHAGHGLDYDTAKIIAQIPQIKELNIGHFIIGESIFDGLEKVIKKMKRIINS